MKRHFVSFVCAVLLAYCAAPCAVMAQEAKAAVMVVGVAHLVAKNDVHNNVFVDSPLSPKRQAEIDDIVRRLNNFHPTKVLVEAAMDKPTTAQHYAAYLAGTYTLTANEVDQFGFKLAKLARNSTIYPIDTFGPDLLNDNPRIDDYLKTHFTSIHSEPFDRFLAKTNELEQHGTYLDLLRYMNTDEAIRANAGFYSVLDTMGREVDDAGSAYVSQWYARNAYIFSNIASVIKPGDRVVVLMGQGHEYLLREFVTLNPNLTYVHPLTYLNEP
jgi:hypothetical protein